MTPLVRGLKNLLLVLLCTTPVLAQTLVDDANMATVVTRYDGPQPCFAAVAINKIDGETVAVPAQGFSIEAGIHSINGLATLDLTTCQPISTDLYIRRTPDLEIDFEAGKTYFIAYDRSSRNVAEWKLIVWKTE